MRAWKTVVVCAVLAGCGGTGAGTDSGPGRDGGPSSMDAGRRDAAAAMMCATMGPETTLEACTDGCSNDDDSFADCEDRDCCAVSGITCGPTTFCGRQSTTDGGTGGGSCSPDHQGPENTLEACSDGCSNDDDAYADCQDRDCCGVAGLDCAANTYCGRNQGDGSVRLDGGPSNCTQSDENTVAACSDGCSNDGDAYADCDERSCCGLVTCGADTYCGRNQGDGGGGTPRDGGACTSGPENTVAACSDGCSNDGDSYVDCDERDCCGIATGCAATTYCGRTDAGATTLRDSGPACSSGAENTVSACSDGCSNDSDRFIDCEDRDCCGVVTCGAATYCGRTDAGPAVDGGAATTTDGGATTTTDGGGSTAGDAGVRCATTGPENTLAACTDGCSNDDDNFVDCEERDCCPVLGSMCGGTTYCATRFDGGPRDAN